MSEKSPPTESELVEFVRSIDVPAPPELHRRIDALVAASAPADRRHRRRLRFGVTGALAAAVIAVVLVLATSSGSSRLTLHTAVALTQRPATMPAPAESPNDDGTLVAHVEDVAFPYWEDRGWRATRRARRPRRLGAASRPSSTTAPTANGSATRSSPARLRRASAAESSSRAAACPTASP